jgi:predicted RNase H-like nuclease (RuvC/YqgF family)
MAPGPTNPGRRFVFMNIRKMFGSIVVLTFLLASSVPITVEGAERKTDEEMGRLKQFRARMKEVREEVRQLTKDEGKLNDRQQVRMGGAMKHLSNVLGDMGNLLSGGDLNNRELRVLSEEMDQLSDTLKRWSDRVKRGTGGGTAAR